MGNWYFVREHPSTLASPSTRSWASTTRPRAARRTAS
jgi:hypothetical protein